MKTAGAVGQEEDKSAGEVARWVSEINLYDKESQQWIERSKKIVRRFKDERSTRDTKGRYNILWSNVQTLQPAIYARNPIPNVERRFQDEDDLSRVASEVLERAVSYYVREDDFFSVMSQVVLDRLLCGRGTAWVRYSVDDDGYEEKVDVDYVHWQDFGHTWGRTWAEVRAVWKKVYMTRGELIKRFGEEVGKAIPLDYTPEKLNDEKTNEHIRKATIYEIWDKPSKTALWIHKDYPRVIDQQPDPYQLKDFFPCPKPLFATLANDSVIPVPDYVEYQDQASELDDLTARIRMITKSIKVAGIYDASAEGVQRLLAEGVDNMLIPVDQYAVLAEKGGLQGVMNLMPMEDILKTLLGLYDGRERVKQEIYEITGISDIIRGATNPNETLGAQQLKGQYADLRLGRMQRSAENFARDLVRIEAELISEHFSLDTLKNISGIKLFTAQEKQQVQMQQQMAQQSGQPLDEQTEVMLQDPTWEEVYELLRNDSLRCFRIDVETDSTIKPDQDAERDARIQFLGSAGGFLKEIAMVPDPQLKPMLLQMFMFGVRGFKVGKDLEGEFEVVLKKMQKQANAPQPEKPDPEQMKLQMQMQVEQQRAQLESQKMQLETQRAQIDAQIKVQESKDRNAAEIQKLQIERERLTMDIEAKKAELALKAQELHMKSQDMNSRLGMDVKKMDNEMSRARMEAKTKVTPDVAMADPDINGGLEVTPMAMIVGQLAEALQNGLMQLAKSQEEGNQRIIEATTKPRKVSVRRDPKTKELHGESV